MIDDQNRTRRNADVADWRRFNPAAIRKISVYPRPILISAILDPPFSILD
jgi:hypothetical protein